MKFKLILSATLALLVSSSAMASAVGELFGDAIDHRGTQCVQQEKAQAESNVGRSAVDSDSSQGKAAASRAS